MDVYHSKGETKCDIKCPQGNCVQSSLLFSIICNRTYLRSWPICGSVPQYGQINSAQNAITCAFVLFEHPLQVVTAPMRGSVNLAWMLAKTRVSLHEKKSRVGENWHGMLHIAPLHTQGPIGQPDSKCYTLEHAQSIISCKDLDTGTPPYLQIMVPWFQLSTDLVGALTILSSYFGSLKTFLLRWGENPIPNIGCSLICSFRYAWGAGSYFPMNTRPWLIGQRGGWMEWKRVE